MRVTHVSTYDSDGGAARAAYRLQDGLLRIGQTSQMFVLKKDGSDPNVIKYEMKRDIGSRLKRNLRQQFIYRGISAYRASAPDGIDFFTDDRTPYGTDPWKQLRDSDIVQLHWISGFLDYLGFFSTLVPHKPVVWTVHGMDALTGGCHYDRGCGRFVEQCGACPQLGSSSETDLTRRVWIRKKKSYAKLAPEQLHIISPSRWLRDEVRRSSLLSRFPCSVVPNGLDTEIFSPRNPRVAREMIGVPQGARAILFIADGLHVPRKGLHLLVDAIAGGNNGGDLFLVCVGPGFPPDLRRFPHKQLDAVRDDNVLSHIYSAADVLVVPSLQENLPNTAVEAISCGTPVAGFAVGGIPDIVRPGLTGSLARPADTIDLRRAIMELLGARDRKAMSENCRRIALDEFSLERQARSYVEIYEQMLRNQAI